MVQESQDLVEAVHWVWGVRALRGDREASLAGAQDAAPRYRAAIDALNRTIAVKQEIARKHFETAQATYATARLFLGGLVVAGLAIGLCFAFIVTRLITRPLGQTVAMLQDIAQGEGDLTKRLPAVTQDEVGELRAGSTVSWTNSIRGNHGRDRHRGDAGNRYRGRDCGCESRAGPRHRPGEQAVAQMDQVVQQTAAQTQELSATAQALGAQADALQVLVGRFKLEQTHPGSAPWGRVPAAPSPRGHSAFIPPQPVTTGIMPPALVEAGATSGNGKSHHAGAGREH